MLYILYSYFFSNDCCRLVSLLAHAGLTVYGRAVVIESYAGSGNHLDIVQF